MTSETGLHHAELDEAEIGEVRLVVSGADDRPTIGVAAASTVRVAIEAVLRRAEAMTAETLAVLAIDIDPGAGPDLAQGLVASGCARWTGANAQILPGLLWQCAARWLPEPRAPFPQLHTLTAGRRHPLRPQPSTGTLYRRAIPWLGRTLSFRTMTEPGDVALFSHWMNDPRVAEVWNERGSLDEHRAYIEGLQADPHTLPLLGCFDGKPFGYFELYWAKESRLGALYEAEDYDRGWHVAIGDAEVRGRGALSAWLPSLMHYLFLDDPRTRRIVGEPRADHAQQIRNLHGSGFGTIATVDFPHKRSVLVALTREHFVRDRLWVPGAAQADAQPRPPAIPVP